jgi:hypothetical protein
VPFKRILTAVRRAWREHRRRRAQAFADEVAEAMDDLRSVAQKAAILDGRRYHSPPRWSSVLRIIGRVLAWRRTRLYLLIACTAIIAAWFVLAEYRGS